MHQDWLIRTLELAKERKGFCSPNPSVGSVVVREGKELSAAFHSQAGEGHAEYTALKALDYPLTGATLYISLEPCSHWGKTPPCIDEIVRSGISKVVFSYSDPNPLVKPFDTIAFFKKNNIDCKQVQVSEITDFYESYRHWLQTKRPFVTLKIAQSLNGKIALKNGASFALTRDELNAFTHQERKKADIILTTATTIVNDNPLFTARVKDETFKKPLAILDRNLTLKNKMNTFTCLSSATMLFYDKQLQTDVDIKYRPIACVNQQLNLEEVLEQLGHEGFHDVWVEAGGTLASALLEKKLVNRFYLYLSPCFLSNDSMNAYTNTLGISFEQYKCVSWQQVGQDMRVTFEF